MDCSQSLWIIPTIPIIPSNPRKPRAHLFCISVCFFLQDIKSGRPLRLVIVVQRILAPELFRSGCPGAPMSTLSAGYNTRLITGANTPASFNEHDQYCVPCGQTPTFPDEVDPPSRGILQEISGMYLRFMVFNEVTSIYLWSGEYER